MLSVESIRITPKALDIPYVTADEAFRLMRTELERFLKLMETLDGDDWDQPTACIAWSVRDILAHQAGGYAGGTGYKEMFRQASSRPKPGELAEDAMNAFQLAERVDKSPTDLIAELSQVGLVAAQKWAYQFRFAKLLAIPHPVPGWLSIRHLMWVIHSRDTWMHRLDICRATNRHFEQSVEHDDRIVQLVMLDVARLLARRLKGRGIVFELSGISGGTWKVGAGEPVSRIKMDVLDFNIFASGRFSYEEARTRAEITGDTEWAEAALNNTLILY